MNDDIDALWRACNHASARITALTGVLSAVVAVVQDDPRFAQALAGIAVTGEQDDELIEVLRQKRDELLPQHLR